MAKSAIAAALAGGLVLFVAGCGGSGDNRAGFGSTSGLVTDSPNLSGTWDLTGLSVAGRSISCPVASTDGNVSSDIVQNILTVNNVEADRCVAGENINFSDGNYTMTYPTPRYLSLTSETGTYSVGGGTLTLTRTSQSYDANGDGVISPTETRTISPGQKLTSKIFVQNGVLVATPQSSDVSADIARSSDGSVVVRTFTKRAQ